MWHVEPLLKFSFHGVAQGHVREIQIGIFHGVVHVSCCNDSQ